jgi:hypothetical protein
MKRKKERKKETTVDSLQQASLALFTFNMSPLFLLIFTFQLLVINAESQNYTWIIKKYGMENFDLFEFYKCHLNYKEDNINKKEIECCKFLSGIQPLTKDLRPLLIWDCCK